MQAKDLTLVPQYEINYLHADLIYLQATKRTSNEAHLTQGRKFNRIDLPQIFFSPTPEVF